jgi:hypothetical protein
MLLKRKSFFSTPSLCVAAGECLQSFEIHYGGGVTMPTAHIFAIFHHNFFFYVYGDNFLLLRTMFFDVVDVGNEKLGKTPFNNLKIEK